MRRPLPRDLLPAAWLAAALTACSGSGGDSAPDTTVEFAALASTLAEEGASAAITLRLATTLPALAEDVVCVVRDSGLGTASNGVDFVHLPEQVLVFAAGSVSGEQRSVSITTLGDGLVEGADETLRLLLNVQSGPAELGLRRNHTLSIVDDDLATLRFRAAASATVNEAQQSMPVEVELTLAPGTQLAVTLRAQVTDATTGTASATSDYAALAPTEVAFSPGAQSGALAGAAVQIVQDGLLESDETVVLALGQASAGCATASPDTHVLTITDDDAGGAATLALSDGGGASLANGQVVALGQPSVGSASAILVHVDNLGLVPLALDLPLIAGENERDFAIELASAALPLGLQAGAASTDLPSIALHSIEAAPAGAITIEMPEGLADLIATERALALELPLPRGERARLVLERQPSPWAADALLVLDGVALEGGAGELQAELSLWRGTVAGADDTEVFLALSPRGARGWIELRGAVPRTLVIEPLRAQPGRSLIVEQAQLLALGLRGPADFCSEAPAVPTPEAGSPTEGLGAGTLLAECRLALESDYQLFQRLGGLASVTDYVTALVAAAAARYRVDVQTQLSIAYLGVHAQPGDGWSTPDLPGTSAQMLDEFRTAWGPNWGGAWPAPANLAHFLSGANLGGGIAYVGVLCNPNFGFAVSANLSGAIDWSSWSGASGPLTWDFVVFAHELGHNFSAAHTHAYCPPLDRCATSCEGGVVCSSGTLMSYCHLCAGGMSNIALQFHPFVANVMRSAVNTSCLGGASLAPGERLTWRIRFAPTAGSGPRRATLEFAHDASNAATPFTLELQGTALP